jgi:hypothetical protein
MRPEREKADIDRNQCCSQGLHIQEAIMKQVVMKHMLKGGIYYTWYRFSQASNYMHFEEWVRDYVDSLSDKEVEEFVARNRIGEV